MLASATAVGGVVVAVDICRVSSDIDRVVLRIGGEGAWQWLGTEHSIADWHVGVVEKLKLRKLTRVLFSFVADNCSEEL